MCGRNVVVIFSCAVLKGGRVRNTHEISSKKPSNKVPFWCLVGACGRPQGAFDQEAKKRNDKTNWVPFWEALRGRAAPFK